MNKCPITDACHSGFFEFTEPPTQNWAYREMKTKEIPFPNHTAPRGQNFFDPRKPPENMFYKIFKPNGKVETGRIIHPYYEKMKLKQEELETRLELAKKQKEIADELIRIEKIKFEREHKKKKQLAMNHLYEIKRERELDWRTDEYKEAQKRKQAALDYESANRKYATLKEELYRLEIQLNKDKHDPQLANKIWMKKSVGLVNGLIKELKKLNPDPYPFEFTTNLFCLDTIMEEIERKKRKAIKEKEAQRIRNLYDRLYQSEKAMKLYFSEDHDFSLEFVQGIIAQVNLMIEQILEVCPTASMPEKYSTTDGKTLKGGRKE